MSRSGNERADRKTVVIPVAKGAVIPAAVLVALDADGNATEAKKAENLIVVGVSQEAVDNTGGLAGAVTVTVRRGAFVLDNSSTAAVTQAGAFKDCYLENSSTVTSDVTKTSVVGKVLQVDPDGVVVEIN